MGGYDSFSRLHNKWMDKKRAHSYNEPQHWWQTTVPFWPSRPLFACLFTQISRGCQGSCLFSHVWDRRKSCTIPCTATVRHNQVFIWLYLFILTYDSYISHNHSYAMQQWMNHWAVWSCPFHWVNAPVHILPDDHFLEAYYYSRIATWTPRKLIWHPRLKSRLQVQQWHQPPTPAFPYFLSKSFTCPPNMEGWIIPLTKERVRLHQSRSQHAWPAKASKRLEGYNCLRDQKNGDGRHPAPFDIFDM